MHSISIIVFLTLLSLLFAASMVVCGNIFAPKNETSGKISTYECGMPVFINDKTLINPRYFVLALLFLLYDAELLLLFPFALAFDILKLYVFFQAFIFILIMVLSLFYAIRRNMVRFR